MFDQQTALGFANTRLNRPSGVVEKLGDPAIATAWLEENVGYRQPRGLKRAEFERLLEVRDGAQRLLRSRLAGRSPDAVDVRLLNDASAAAPVAAQLDATWNESLRFSGSGSAEPQSLDELLAALATATISLAADASVDLAECGADDCVVIFERTDPRRRWHNDRCGNRMRAARSYARHKADAAQA